MANATKDKIIVLTQDGQARTPGGLLDKRLFTGKNRLHAVMEDNGLWSLHYDSGVMNEPLKQKFTSFHILLKTVKQYFERRNVRVKEVIE